MRTSFILSVVLHSLVLTLALVGFGSHTTLESPQPVPINIVDAGAISALQAGKLDADTDKAAGKFSPPPNKTTEASRAPSKAQLAETVSRKQAALPPPKPKAPAPQEANEAQKPQSPAQVESRPEPAPPRPDKAAKSEPKRQAADREALRARQRASPKEAVQQKDDRIRDLIGRPTSAPQGQSDFDPSRIAALLNRDPTAGDVPPNDEPRKPWRKPGSLERQAAGLDRREPEHFARGAPEGRDWRLAANEIDAFRAQISRCWTPPVGGLGGDAIIIKLRIVLNEDGSLASAPDIANTLGSPFFRPAADSAVRAVIQCQPYRLPPEKYGQWRDILLTFDPSRMYGG